MSAIRGKLVNGRVILNWKADWPEGCEVFVERLDGGESLGIRDEDWPKTSEGIAELLVRMSRVEPFEMTPEEEAELAAWRKQVKDYTLRHMDDDILNLFP